MEIYNRQAYFMRVPYRNAQFTSKQKFTNLTTTVHELMLKQM